MPAVVEQDQLDAETSYVGVIALPGTDGPKIMALVRRQHIPCLTTDTALVEAGHCVVAVRSSPRIEVVVSNTAAHAAGLDFAAAFRLMVRFL